MKKFLYLDPYRIHFLIGALAAVLGVTIWIMFELGFVTAYPILAHARTMVAGFLMSFVMGFLMTAVPRMTSTTKASVREKALSAFLTIVMLACTFGGMPKVAWLFVLGQFGFLFFFFFSRAYERKGESTHSGFVYIPFALLAGAIGAAVLAYNEFGGVYGERLGKRMLYEAFLLNLIIGLGSRLIPMLTKKNSAISPLQVQIQSSSFFFWQALIFNTSFLIEIFANERTGMLIRGLVLLSVLFTNFGLHRPAVEKTNVARGITISATLMPLAYLLAAAWPDYRLHLIHILYIGGLALLTLMVSIRVTLAHGGHSLEIEKSAKIILVIPVFALAAIVARSLGPIFWPQALRIEIIIAGVFFLAMIFCWLRLLGRILVCQNFDVEKC